MFKNKGMEDTGLSSKFQTHTQRIIDRDGNFNVTKTGISKLESFNLYHYLINESWGKFFFHSLIFYVLTNIVFSFVYYWAGVEHLGIDASQGFFHSFVNAFFFSAQTLTTVGFGRVNPQNFSTNVIATLEAGIGLMVFAIATGLLYGRFSRPATNIKYSSNAIITKWENGLTAFQFRLANAYSTVMMDAELKVMASWLETENGEEKRKFYALKLEYDKIVFFPSMWTANHIIDESSPMYGKTQEDLHKTEAEFLILFKAYDDTFIQTVNSRYSYRHDEILWNVKFTRGILTNGDGQLLIDLERLNLTEKIEN